MSHIPVIDAYCHIGLPRFQTAEIALAQMDANGIDRALACPFETCPDLVEVHRAYTLAPDRIRPFGLALGRDRAEVEAGLHAQFDAGFEGMRLTLDKIAEKPWVLEVIAERKGIPLMVGGNAMAAQAGVLLRFLQSHPDSIIICPHMAGPTTPDIFDTEAEVRALFCHPQFHVIVSRQTMGVPEAMMGWTRALIQHVGWERLLWGSEVPVLYWRDETLAEMMAWIDRCNPSADERAGFLGGNTERVLFGRPKRSPAPLVLPYDPMALATPAPAPMWPRGLAADNALPAPLVAAWMADGGPVHSTLGDYASALLLDAARRRLALSEEV
ncbi:MAG: amidohydrolase family protein [Cypionkella sp.]